MPAYDDVHHQAKRPTSKLMLTALAGVATWEREIMLERQREGIAAAKAAGNYKGRPANIDAAKIKRLAHAGDPIVSCDRRRYKTDVLV